MTPPAPRIPGRPSSRRFGLVAGTGAATLCALLWLTFGANGGQPDARPAALGTAMVHLLWRVGDQRSYDIRLASDVALDADASGDVLAQVTSGRLHLRVATIDGDDVELHCRLAPLEVSIGGQRDDVIAAELCAAPIAVQLGRDGTMRQIDFDASVREQAAALGEEILRTFQFVVPTHAEATWSTTERHGAGAFAAEYTRDGDDPARIEKRKLRYLDGSPAGHSEVRSSVATAVLGRTASWLDRFELREHTVVVRDGRPFMSAELTATLLPVTLTGDEDPFSTDALARADLVRREAVARTVTVAASPTAADRARLFALIAELDVDDGRNNALLHALRDLLIAFPELAEELPAQIARRDLGDGTAAAVVHALELAGNGPCQSALSTVLQSDEQTPMNRIRAIVALGGVDAPNQATISTLWETHAGRFDPLSIDRANTALLSLGRAAAALSDPALRGQLMADLELALDSAHDSSTVAIALKAIGNTATGEPRTDAATTHELHAAVKARLDATAPTVRAAAAQALAEVGSAADTPELLQRALHDPDGAVRAEFVRSLHTHSIGESSTCRELVAHVSRETDPHARGAIARYLADSLESYPDGRSTLRDLLRSITDNQLRRHIASKMAATRSDR